MTTPPPIPLLPMSQCRPVPGDAALLYFSHPVCPGYRIGIFRPEYSDRRGDTGEAFTRPAYWQVAGWGGADLDAIPYDDPHLAGWYPLTEPRPTE